jgi:hypothetical protein
MQEGSSAAYRETEADLSWGKVNGLYSDGSIMEKEEIRQLLPFYAAGTLSPEERRLVAQELEGAHDLQLELEFWQLTREAIVARARFAAEGHPSASELEEYESWTLKDAKRRQQIENHLRACNMCWEAYDLLKEIPDGEHYRPTLLEKARKVLASIRMAYAVPALATMLVAAILMYREFTPSDEERTAYIALEYTLKTRDQSAGTLPVLTLTDKTQEIVVTIAVPHNHEMKARYNIALQQEGESLAQLAASLPPFFRGLPDDSMRVTVRKQRFEGRHGMHELFISEDPASIDENPLPPLSIKFKVEFIR